MAYGSREKLQRRLDINDWKFFNIRYILIPIQVSYIKWTFRDSYVAYRYLHVFGFRIARWRV